MATRQRFGGAPAGVLDAVTAAQAETQPDEWRSAADGRIHVDVDQLDRLVRLVVDLDAVVAPAGATA